MAAPKRVGLAAALAVIAVAGCSSSAATHGAPAAPDAAATRWWSSADDYCGMLSDTLAARKAILPGVTSTDPRLLTTTQAFVADIRGAAPAAVAGAWGVLGPAIVGLVKSGGVSSELPLLDARSVQQAAAQVAGDARSRCGLNLSSAAPATR